jgi:hypothetical protein
MKKTGNLCFLFLMLVFCMPILAQKDFIDLSVSKNKVEVGEVFTLTITSNIRSNQGNIGINLPPTFKKVGMTSQGSSDLEINGRVFIESTVSQGYICTKAGKYNVGPAVIAGKKSQSLILEVVKDNTTQLNMSTPVLNSNEPVFGKISSPKSKVFVGESFVIDSKIYSRFNVVGIDQSYTLSKAKGGLETINLQDPSKYNTGQLAINGVQHVFIDFAKQLCFSNTPGMASLSPFSGTLQIETGFFPENASLTSNAFQIEVKPLPPGKPESFIGLVGVFNFELNQTKTSLIQGETFPIILQVSGVGNLHLVAQPKLLLPEGFEIYGEVKRGEEIQYTNDGAAGNVIFTYNIRATKAGRISFPAQAFSFFDPASESYKTSVTNAFEVNVASNPNFKADTSKLDIDLTKNSRSSIFWRVLLALIAMFVAIFMFFRLRKSTQKPNVSKSTAKVSPLESISVSAEKKPVVKDTLADFPADLAFMSTGNMCSILYNAIVKSMQSKTGQEFAAYPDLIELLKNDHLAQVVKIEQIVSIINLNRYGGEGMMEQRQKESLIQATRDVLKEF